MQRPVCKPNNSPLLRTYARVPPTGPYAPNRSRPASNALSLYWLQILAHRAGPGATGAGQATGAPRPQPRRRHHKIPNTNTPGLPGMSPRNQPTELQATRTTRSSFPTPQAPSSTPRLDPEAVALATVNYPIREHQPKFSIPPHYLTSTPGVPGRTTKGPRTRLSF